MTKTNIIQQDPENTDIRDIHEFLKSDVHKWIEANLAVYGNKHTKQSLYEYLADKVDIGPRQLKRYLDGSSDVPTKKALMICKEIGTTDFFQAINSVLNLDTCELPELPFHELDNCDIADELLKNISNFTKQAKTLSVAVNKAPSMEMLHKVKDAGRAARRQILVMESLYAQHFNAKAQVDYAKQKAARLKRMKKAAEKIKKTGQVSLFDEE